MKTNNTICINLHINLHIFLFYVGASKRPLTRQKNLGPDPSKKRYGPITFVKKHWSFHRAIGAYGPAETGSVQKLGPYRFFDGSGPKFVCRVKGLKLPPRVLASGSKPCEGVKSSIFSNDFYG